MKQVHMPEDHKKDIEDLADLFEPPVLVISTRVGKGIISIGDAVVEKLQSHYAVYHYAIEDFLPPAALNEDVKRYKLISNHFPVLLNIVYRFPLIYYRKYLRQKMSCAIQITALQETIEKLAVRTVICCSHRPAFWTSSLKRQAELPVKIWGLLSEFGRNLGWKYIFWKHMNGYLSPMPYSTFDYSFPPDCNFFEINLPAKQEYSVLKKKEGDRNKVLLVCGFWGQGPLLKIISSLRKHLPLLSVMAVCGDNEALFSKVSGKFSHDNDVRVFGAVSSLAPLLSECASIITKPGIATILEGNAAGRKIFLLKGMPVAEDNNARYALNNFGAEWFSVHTFRTWWQNANPDIKINNTARNKISEP